MKESTDQKESERGEQLRAQVDVADFVYVAECEPTENLGEFGVIAPQRFQRRPRPSFVCRIGAACLFIPKPKLHSAARRSGILSVIHRFEPRIDVGRRIALDRQM